MSAKRSQSKAAPRPQSLGRAHWLLVFLTALAVLAFVGVGCGSDDSGTDTGETGSSTAESDPYTVGWMVLNLTNEFFVDQEKEMKELIPEYGGEVIFINAEDDPTKQLQKAQDLLNAGKVDVLAGSVVDVNAFQPVLDQAAEKDVGVVLLGYEPEELLQGQAVVTQNFLAWGEVGGEAWGKCINERFGGEAEVAILTGPNLPGPVVNDRIKGLKAGLAKSAPGAEIVAEASGEADKLKSLQSVQTVLQAHPDLAGAGSVADASQLGALQAFKNDGADPSKICLVGMDGTAEGMEALDKGEFFAEVDIGLPQIYEATLDAVAALAADPTDPEYSEQIIVTDTFSPLFG